MASSKPTRFVSGSLLFTVDRVAASWHVEIAHDGRRVCVAELPAVGEPSDACAQAFLRVRDRLPEGAANLKGDILTFHPALTWGGMDFDANELDRDVLGSLARVAPPSGSLRALSRTAQCKDAVAAADADAALLRSLRREAAGEDLEGPDTAQERALDALGDALALMGKAQALLAEAHEAWMQAHRILS